DATYTAYRVSGSCRRRSLWRDRIAAGCAHCQPCFVGQSHEPAGRPYWWRTLDLRLRYGGRPNGRPLRYQGRAMTHPAPSFVKPESRKLATVAVLVQDYDEAAAWYRTK